MGRAGAALAVPKEEPGGWNPNGLGSTCQPTAARGPMQASPDTCPTRPRRGPGEHVPARLEAALIPHHQTLGEREARALLQKLRDLNLLGCAIEVRPGEHVRLLGCTSLDGPVEQGVRYRLLRGDGRTEVLSLAFRGGRLGLSRDTEGHGSGNGAGTERDLWAEAYADRFGRVSVPALRARIDLCFPAPRELEHFLRRAVRSSFRRPA